MVHVRRNAEVAGNMEMVEGGLEVFDPAAPRDGNSGVAEQRNVGGRVGLKRSDEDEGNVVGGEALRAQDVLWELGVGANDLGFGIAEETEPYLIDDGEVLRRAGVDEDVLAAALDEVDDRVHLFALVPGLHPVDFGAGHPEGAAVKCAHGIFHAVGPPWVTNARNFRMPSRNTPMSLPMLIMRN